MKITKKELFKFCDDNNDAINELQSQSDSTDFLLAVLIQQLKDSGVIDEVSPEPKPQLKQLDQSVFKNMHERWRFAAIDADGSAHRFSKEVFPYRDGFWFEGDDYSEFKFSLIGKGYDASNWQNSLIERDTAKELLEVYLSSELTGSDLCRAMLANASKPIMCAVSDISTSTAMSLGNYDLIHDYTDEHSFMSLNQTWVYAIPINNQGEPLTAKEVGL